MAIADPPYLGRASRWYGPGGRGSGGGQHRADEHEGAAEWDNPRRHLELLRELQRDYHAWAVALAPDSLPLYLSAVPFARVLVWHKRNAVPSGARVRGCWEPVLVWTPRRAYGSGLPVNDVLDAPAPGGGFAGAKPAAWTRWVLEAMGYTPGFDSVADLFGGSGRVAEELAQGVLPLEVGGQDG
ncbi:hypothetical protein VG1_CDS0071 [Arthrobacter phage Cupello]|nr:hypothetical protein VG1_CDS0071 [Arthrobacter phage Cupello]